jgi:hypothetical protein
VIGTGRERIVLGSRAIGNETTFRTAFGAGVGNPPNASIRRWMSALARGLVFRLRSMPPPSVADGRRRGYRARRDDSDRPAREPDAGLPARCSSRSRSTVFAPRSAPERLLVRCAYRSSDSRARRRPASSSSPAVRRRGLRRRITFSVRSSASVLGRPRACRRSGRCHTAFGHGRCDLAEGHGGFEQLRVARRWLSRSASPTNTRSGICEARDPHGNARRGDQAPTRVAGGGARASLISASV